MTAGTFDNKFVMYTWMQMCMLIEYSSVICGNKQQKADFTASNPIL